jgi:hypothetical protein
MYWVSQSLFVKRLSIPALYLLETQGHQYTERLTNYACVKVKILSNFSTYQSKHSGNTAIDLGHTVTLAVSRRPVTAGTHVQSRM